MTPAVRALEAASIEFTIHEYERSDDLRDFGREAAAALGLDPDLRDRRPIARIARDRNVPVEILIRDVNEALKAAKSVEAPVRQ